MAKRVAQSGSETTRLKNKTFQKINLWAVCVHTTANTAFDGDNAGTSDPIFDTNQVNVQINTSQFGENHKNYAGVLRPALAPTVGTALYQYAKGDQYIVYTAAASGIKEVVLIPMSIEFCSPINLKGNDFTDVAVQVSNAFSAECDTSLSYLYFEAQDAVGVQLGVPVIETVHLGENIGDNHTLGDGVQKIVLADFAPEYGTQTAISPVFTNFLLASDKLPLSGDIYELLLERMAYNTANDTALADNQTYCIYDEETPLNRAQLTVTVNTTNKATSRQYIVSSACRPHSKIAARGVSMADRHLKENVSDLRG